MITTIIIFIITYNNYINTCTVNNNLPIHIQYLITYTYSHYKNEADLASKALALALTRVMLNLPYSPDTAEDLGQLVRVAIRVASLSRPLPASSPQQPFVSMHALLREYKPSPSGCIFHHWLHACGVQQPTQRTQPSHSLRSK